MIDFHSHVLPGIDDGAADVAMSAEMLMLSKKQGVDIIVATPHFYPWVDTVDSFLEKREKSFKELMEYVKEHKLDIPQIVLGAEVAFTQDILNIDLGKLAIENTDAVLIELPFEFWNEWIYKELYGMSMKCGLDIILAHIERYIPDHRDLTMVEPFFDMNMYIQVNADGFLERRYKKIVKKLAKNNKIHLLGSDSHNLENRVTRMDEAYKTVQKKFGADYLEKIMNNGIKILKK